MQRCSCKAFRRPPGNASSRSGANVEEFVHEHQCGPREWSLNIIRELEDATWPSVRAKGVTATMVDEKPETPGWEVAPGGWVRAGWDQAMSLIRLAQATNRPVIAAQEERSGDMCEELEPSQCGLERRKACCADS